MSETLCEEADEGARQGAQPNARVMVTCLRRTLPLILAALTAGCGLLYPEPAPAPPTSLPLDHADFQRALFEVDPEAELETCLDRMDALYALSACERSRTVRGETVLCGLEPPWESLRFGCVGEEDGSPRVELKSAEAEALQPMVDAALGRSCALSANAIFTGAREPRWEGDRGTLSCIYVGAMMSYGPGLGSEHPQGLFLDVNAREAPRDALSQPESVQPVSLRLETRRLDAEARERALTALSEVMAKASQEAP